MCSLPSPASYLSSDVLLKVHTPANNVSLDSSRGHSNFENGVSSSSSMYETPPEVVVTKQQAKGVPKA